MSVTRLLQSSVIAGAVLSAAGLTFAESTDLPGADSLSLSSAPAPAQAGATADAARVAFLDDAAAEKPNIHGFAEVPFKTAYITPRGLVVEDKGLVIQPVAGLVFPIGDLGPVKDFTIVTGVWNSINTAQADPSVGPWNELDYFVSASGSVSKFTGTLTYSPWNSPPHAFKTEHTADFKLAYDDKGLLIPDFALNPYIDFFYSISGDSTVILGRKGSTYYFELGVAPSYTLKAIPDYPLTFTFPTYFSVGPENYWGRGDSALSQPDGNFGVFSTAINASVPLSFIPARLGFWHADLGIQYFYLINDALLNAGTLASGNTSRSVFNASIGIGVNF